MVIPKIIKCPICGKRTYLRIEDGGYLNEYPIRFNCMNCKALLKGVYIMYPDYLKGLHMLNGDVEDVEIETTGSDENNYRVTNADYIAHVSGELPVQLVQKYDGQLPISTPYLETVSRLQSPEELTYRLMYFTKTIEEWKKSKNIAFQLLDEGSMEYLPTALKNKMGAYHYQCDNMLKAMHCLQEVVHEDTKNLFVEPNELDEIQKIIKVCSHIDREKLHEFVQKAGGTKELIIAYRKAISVFSDFMVIYPNVLPAETFLHYKNKENADNGIATCSFVDLKNFCQDAYESMNSLLYIPVCLDNIINRGDCETFSDALLQVFRKKKLSEDLSGYKTLDNGTRFNKLTINEPIQKIIEMPSNSIRWLRNGIGHNNVSYDGITQMVTSYDMQDPEHVRDKRSLMQMAIDCISLTKSAIILSEIILFVLREEYRREDVRTVLHPHYYYKIEPNDKCPCGSGLKYKKCCKNDIDVLLRQN